MDTLYALLIGIALFAAFVLFTAYFLKSYIVMNSMQKSAENGGSIENRDKRGSSEPKEQK